MPYSLNAHGFYANDMPDAKLITANTALKIIQPDNYTGLNYSSTGYEFYLFHSTGNAYRLYKNADKTGGYTYLNFWSDRALIMLIAGGGGGGSPTSGHDGAAGGGGGTAIFILNLSYIQNSSSFYKFIVGAGGSKTDGGWGHVGGSGGSSYCYFFPASGTSGTLVAWSTGGGGGGNGNAGSGGSGYLDTSAVSSNYV